MVAEPDTRHAAVESQLEEPGDEQPLLILRKSKNRLQVDYGEIWRYRDLLLALARRDVKLRYRQTALGALWVVLQPLIAAWVLSFVFGRVAKMPSPGVPYFLFAYAGMLAWNMFSGTLTRASGSLVQNSQLVSKVYFPRAVVPLSTVFSSLIDFAVALGMLFVMMLFAGIHPTAHLLLLPVWVALVLILSVGCGLFTAALMVSYRDVQYVVPVLTQFLMFASPVAYSVDAVEHKLRAVYTLNPLSGLLEAFRWSLLGRGTLHVGEMTASVVFTVLAFLIGSASFRAMEKKFADVI